MPACRHCGSPRRFNPCWYGITVDKWAAGKGYDPPCLEDIFNEEAEERRRARRRRGCAATFVAIMLIAAFVYLAGGSR